MRQILNGTFAEFHKAGCIQTGADVHPDVEQARSHFEPMFNVLMQITNNFLCDGCPVLNGGKCPAHKQFAYLDMGNVSLLDVAAMPLADDLYVESKNLEHNRVRTRHRQGALLQNQNRKGPLRPKHEGHRNRCTICGNKIRGANHNDHCKPREG